jgi:hypothetical protein
MRSDTLSVADEALVKLQEGAIANDEKKNWK